MRKEWSDEETELLKEKYNTISNEELLKLFPERTYVSIYKKARKLGIYKNKNIEFINRSIARKGEKASNWNGGRRKTSKGYIQILKPNHPRSDSAGYVMEHIVVFEEETGIRIPPNCCIHHLNGVKSDNRIENLCMMTHAAHTVFHHKGIPCSPETIEKIKKTKRGHKNE